MVTLRLCHGRALNEPTIVPEVVPRVSEVQRDLVLPVVSTKEVQDEIRDVYSGFY